MVTIICASLCLIYCAYAIFHSYRDIEKGHYGNYAQNVVTLGVLFTFIGVSISLYNFNVKNIDASIGVFLEGMKLAFITSIIGMIAGLIIKFIQRNHMNYSADQTSAFYDDIKNLKQTIEGQARASADFNDSIKSKLDDMNAHLKKNDMELFSASLDKFCAAVNLLAESTGSSQDEMKRLSQNMSQQAQVLTSLGEYLKTSFDNMIEKQGEQMTAMRSMFESSISDLGRQINNMDANLGDKISRSGKEQSAQLTSMNDSISAMKESAIQSESYSKEMRDKTIAFHENSIKNQEAQNDILRSNTDSILAMRDSFAEFVNNVQKVFGDAVINALNDSMNRLNDQLETQFGENFKELNMAVKDVVKWQQQYKETVEMTVGELKQIDSVFHQFIEVVSKDVEARIYSLDQSLKQFGEINDQNISIQKSLTSTTAQTSEALLKLQSEIKTVQDILGSFDSYAIKVAEGVKKSLDEQNNMFLENIKAVDQGIRKIYEDTTKEISQSQSAIAASLLESQNSMMISAEAISDSALETADSIEVLKKESLDLTINIKNYISSIEETTKNVQKSIGKTLESFSSDFSEEAEEAIKHLDEMFEKIYLETAKQHDNSVKTLAASLAAISDQMIKNYSALVDRIERVDKLLKGR